MASGAGLNRASVVALNLVSSTTAVSTPLSSYGTTGLNDTGPIPVLAEARDFTKWTFSMIGGGTGYSVSVYGTIDPVAYATWKNALNPNLYLNNPNKPSTPASSWFLLPAPAEQTGTGGVANPMTATSPLLQFSGALVGVRLVLTTASTPSGVVKIVVEAAP